MLERHYAELLKFLVRQIRDRDTAADLAQESYVRILTLQQSGEAVADPRALLYRIARNLLIDRHRHGAVRNHESLDDRPDAGQPAAPRHQQPEEIYAFARYAEAMAEAIESLPLRCREAFILSRFEGLTHQQVAERMGISRNMVAQHIMRGILVCKACNDRFHGSGQDGERPAP